MKDELLLPSDFLSSLNVVSSLPVKADPTDMMSEMKSNQNWRMVCVSTIKNSECKYSLSTIILYTVEPPYLSAWSLHISATADAKPRVGEDLPGTTRQGDQMS